MFEGPDPTAVGSPEDLASEYLGELAAAIDEGSARGIPASVREAIDTRDPGGVTIDQAATILSRTNDTLDSAAIEAELRDRLLIEMSTAVVDVDALAESLSLERSPKELQQRIESRAPMTVREYAHIRAALAARMP